jgi:hypothetical protein
MIPTLLSTLTVAIIGTAEISPGICQVEMLVDSELKTEIIHCPSNNSEG